jgi:hypothetical protein
MLAAVLADLIESVLDQLLHPALELIADLSHLVDRLLGRVLDVPVLDHRGDERALRPAGQGHRPVGVELHLEGEALRLPARQVDPDLVHRLHHHGVDGVGGLRPGRLGSNAFRRVAFEEGLSHLRATGVLGADEQDVLHRTPPLLGRYLRDATPLTNAYSIDICI